MSCSPKCIWYTVSNIATKVSGAGPLLDVLSSSVLDGCDLQANSHTDQEVPSRKSLTNVRQSARAIIIFFASVLLIQSRSGHCALIQSRIGRCSLRLSESPGNLKTSHRFTMRVITYSFRIFTPSLAHAAANRRGGARPTMIMRLK
eukprot:6171860-Pleurochrysis_carterae.AAC.1